MASETPYAKLVWAGVAIAGSVAISAGGFCFVVSNRLTALEVATNGTNQSRAERDIELNRKLETLISTSYTREQAAVDQQAVLRDRTRLDGAIDAITRLRIWQASIDARAGRTGIAGTE